jgi:hypothetical protein
MGVKSGLSHREEHRLRLLENRVVMLICGPKREQVAGEWSRLHNEQLYDLHIEPNIIWVTK